MAKLTNQIDNLNKRVVALENSELSGTDAVPFIVKLYTELTTGPEIYCSEEIEVSEDLYLSEGAVPAAQELATILNYGAIGSGAVPNLGDIGIPLEEARKPSSSITIIDSLILLSSYFDEQTANGKTLTSAAILGSATETTGTGKVVASGILNIDKTASKTLTVSAEIEIKEV